MTRELDETPYSTDGAICPYCGHLNSAADDNYQLYSEDTCDWECGICSEAFNVEVFTRHSWTTRKREADE